LYSIDITKDTIAPLIFYMLMGGGLVFLLINPFQFKEVIFHKSFLFLLIINLINFVYLLFFDIYFNQESLEYLMARFVSFSLISLSVYYNFNYFKTRFPVHLINVIALVVIIGLFIDPFIFSGRYDGIIWNPNMLASISVIAFAFLFLKEEKTGFEKFLMFLLLLVVLSTGSRGVLIAIVLSFILKFGFSFRNIFYSIMGIGFVVLISNTNLDTSLNRISSQGLFNDRTDQFYFALETLKKELFTGYGLYEYSGMPENIETPEELEGLFLGSHNGYLSILIQYGIIFGGIIIMIIFRKSIQLINYFRSMEDLKNIYLFIIIYTLLAANFESLLTGINEFHTILFWFSLSYLSYSKFRNEHAI